MTCSILEDIVWPPVLQGDYLQTALVASCPGHGLPLTWKEQGIRRGSQAPGEGEETAWPGLLSPGFTWIAPSDLDYSLWTRLLPPIWNSPGLLPLTWIAVTCSLWSMGIKWWIDLHCKQTLLSGFGYKVASFTALHIIFFWRDFHIMIYHSNTLS